MHTLTLLSDVVLTHLLWASIQTVVLVGALWLVCRLLPRLPATVRSALWWLVAAQLLVGFIWPMPVRLPVLAAAAPPAVVAARPAQMPSSVTVTPAPRPTMRLASGAVPSAAAQVVKASPEIPWREGLLVLWLAGLVVEVVIVAGQWRVARRLRNASRALEDERVQAICKEQARRLGLRRCPTLRVCSAITSPQVTGLLHPVVLLPVTGALTPDECAMALAHELAHVRHGDLWWSWAPTAARALFFFHPLVHFAVREYAFSREAACDSLALRAHRTAPQTYGRLLLRLGVEQPMPAGLAGVASPSFRHLKRRLTLLQNAANLPRVHDWVLVAIVALAFVVPYRAVAARDSITTSHGSAVAEAANHLLPPPPPPPAPPPPPVPPVPPAPPAPPAPAASATDRFSFQFKGSSVDIDTTPHAHDSMAMFTNNVDVDTSPGARDGIGIFTKDSVVISGTQADLAIAKHLYQAKRTPMLWFRDGDKAYVSHDPTVIEQAQVAYAGAIAARRAAAHLDAEKWGVKGPLEGLQSWQASIRNRTRSLQADSSAPAQRERLASLKQQQVTVATRIAALQRKLVAFHPKEAAMAHTVQQATADADLKVERVVRTAVADGKAQPATA